MNIWLINHYAIPPSRAGGTRHHTFAKLLGSSGNDVTIVASSFDHATRQETRLGPHENFRLEVVDGVRYLWIRTRPYQRNSLARLVNTLEFAFRLLYRTPLNKLGSPDAIVGSSPHLFAPLAGLRLARRYGVPFILEVRDIWPQSLIDLSGISEGNLLMKIFSAIERHLYSHADHIVSLLPGAKDFMIERGAAAERVTWIPNYANLESAPPATALPEGNPFTLVYAGAHGVANDLDTILSAAGILKARQLDGRFRFRIVGEGPEKARLLERVRAEELAHVSMEPSIPKEQIHQLLADADACLMILKDSPVFRWGVSPNKLFDYMAAARPTLFCVNTHFNPILDAQGGLSVRPGDPEALAASIIELSELSADRRAEMGRSARRYVEMNHDASKLSVKLEQMLLAVVARHEAIQTSGLAGTP